MNGGGSMWAITPEERGKHDKQFDSLTPTLGHVTGEQARKFFLQSGLPAAVLAEIWALADLGGDGMMDRLEFSIAMKLIKLKLQGRGLPSCLPIIMKQQPPLLSNPASAAMMSSTRFGTTSIPNLVVGAPAPPPAPPMPAAPLLAPIAPLSKPLLLAPVPATLPLVPTTLPLVPAAGLANGSATLLTPSPVGNPAGMSGFSSPMANSLLDLASSSSNSSSTTSLASNSPKTGASDWPVAQTGVCDWSVPQASRLKYRQHFNTLDKMMTGYLSGPQVRNALTSSNLTHTQLATIWSLSDVDRDGQLRAEEFILAMHLVDTAKTGRPLPLTLTPDLVPPSMRAVEMVNGTGPYGPPTTTTPTPGPLETPEVEKTSFEERLRENFARGSAELEKRRLALEEERRRERERREREEREQRERREREARQQESRRRSEEERRLERHRETERQREEERRREEERKEQAEHQRVEAWERARREELGRRRQGDKEAISILRAKKRSLETELEAVGNKHKQISDRLRDAQSKRRIQRAELDLTNQKRDARICDINALQLQFEEWQRKLSQLVPEQQRLNERLRLMDLKTISAVTLTSAMGSAREKGATCRRLKEQLDALERETTCKLERMDLYSKEIQFVDMDDCVLRGLLSLLACLNQLFLLIKELREKQSHQQGVLNDLYRVKEQRAREVQRHNERETLRLAKLEEEERREEERREEERREEERREQERRDQEARREEARREEERREQERRDQEAGEEEARQQREEEEEAQDRLRAAQEKAEGEEEEEEAQRIWRASQQEAVEQVEVEEEATHKRREEEEEEEEKTEEQERRSREEERGGGGHHPVLAAPSPPFTLTSYRALYPFMARNAEELTLDADCLIEVEEQTVGEPGWLCGSYQGRRGWFPQSYAQKCPLSAAPKSTSTTTTHTAAPPNAPHGGNLLPPSSSPCPERPPNAGVPDGDGTAVNCSPAPDGLEPITATVTVEATPPLEDTPTLEEDTPPLEAASGNAAEPIYSSVEEFDSPDSPGQLEEFVALYAYESLEAGDLAFLEGDVVLVTQREGAWWRGCIGDTYGLFPSNYVRPVVVPETEVMRPGGPIKKPDIAQAVSTTVAHTGEQLSLCPGQLIVVRAKNSSGWWLGELQARGKKRQSGWFHSRHVKLLMSPTAPSSGKNTPSPLPVCQVIALYDYTAANQDELSFAKGQLISVLDTSNPDWWKGEAGGVTGLLPTNYVKMTTESDPAQKCE